MINYLNQTFSKHMEEAVKAVEELNHVNILKQLWIRVMYFLCNLIKTIGMLTASYWLAV